METTSIPIFVKTPAIGKPQTAGPFVVPALAGLLATIPPEGGTTNEFPPEGRRR